MSPSILESVISGLDGPLANDFGSGVQAAAFEKTPRPAAEPAGAFTFHGACPAEPERPERDATKKAPSLPESAL
jgi:hypothetical protein